MIEYGLNAVKCADCWQSEIHACSGSFHTAQLQSRQLRHHLSAPRARPLYRLQVVRRPERLRLRPIIAAPDAAHVGARVRNGTPPARPRLSTTPTKQSRVTHSYYYFVSAAGSTADLHMAQMMPLPLTVSCFSKIQIGFTFLVPIHLGSPGKGAIKRVCVSAADTVDSRHMTAST